CGRWWRGCHVSLLRRETQSALGKTGDRGKQTRRAGCLGTDPACEIQTRWLHGEPERGTGVASALQRLKAPGFELKDVDSLTGILEQSWVLVVSADSPLRTLSELTAHLKAKGSKASYGTATTVGTVVAERYKAIAQLEAVQVNYKTIADSLNDLASDSLDFVMADTGFTLGQVSKGTLRALVLSSARRAQYIPGVSHIGVGGM